MDTGDTAWVLASAALVMLMTPGLAFFYGGMVRVRSALNMMMMSFLALGIVSVLWVLYGFTVAFGKGDSPLFGGTSYLNFNGVLTGAAVNGAELTIPMSVFAVFQLMFAVITAALISGAVADRTKFLGWGIFIAVWVSLVYFPVAHWVFAFGDAEGNGAGLLAGWGVLDFAGGTAVHINAGAAALALAVVLGKRHGWPSARFRPHSLPLVLLGAGLLWFGWFGFNAGSALGAGELAGLAFVNTQVCTAAALVSWLVVERIRDGHATSLGAASGAVAGLVAITPACAFLEPWAAILLGIIAGALCALAVGLKYRFGYDDSLDVVGVHLVGGLIGCIYIGFMATTGVNEAGGDGLFYGGGAELLVKQTGGALLVMVYSLVVTALIGLAIKKTIGFTLDADEQETGADLVEHAETGYDLAVASAGFRAPGSTATKVPNDATEVKA